VDGMGRIESIEQADGECRIWIAPPPDVERFIIRKGSIAIDGVSLTIASHEAGRFSVALIPTTLSRTNLPDRRTGDIVNLECDILVRAVVSRIDAMFEQASGDTRQ